MEKWWVFCIRTKWMVPTGGTPTSFDGGVLPKNLIQTHPYRFRQKYASILKNRLWNAKHFENWPMFKDFGIENWRMFTDFGSENPPI